MGELIGFCFFAPQLDFNFFTFHHSFSLNSSRFMSLSGNKKLKLPIACSRLYYFPTCQMSSTQATPCDASNPKGCSQISPVKKECLRMEWFGQNLHYSASENFTLHDRFGSYPPKSLARVRFSHTDPWATARGGGGHIGPNSQGSI